MGCEKRMLFFLYKEKIERELLTGKTKVKIWKSYNTDLKCSYPTFVRLCNDYIGKKVTKLKQQTINTEYEKNHENAVVKQKLKSIRPSLTGRKINFTPEPSRERFKQWLSRADDKKD